MELQLVLQLQGSKTGDEKRVLIAASAPLVRGSALTESYGQKGVGEGYKKPAT